jgi:hypothetical protein
MLAGSSRYPAWSEAVLSCVPNGIRTRAAALKGRSPRPLDDGDVGWHSNLNVRSYPRPLTAHRTLFDHFAVIRITTPVEDLHRWNDKAVTYGSQITSPSLGAGKFVPISVIDL